MSQPFCQLECERSISFPRLTVAPDQGLAKYNKRREKEKRRRKRERKKERKKERKNPKERERKR